MSRTAWPAKVGSRKELRIASRLAANWAALKGGGEAETKLSGVLGSDQAS